MADDMDHEAGHPPGFTEARLVAFIRLHGGHERQVVHLTCLARRPLSHDRVLEHGVRVVDRS